MGSPPLCIPLEAGLGRCWRCPDQSLLERGERGLHCTPRELIPACSWPEKGQRGNRQVVEKKEKLN